MPETPFRGLSHSVYLDGIKRPEQKIHVEDLSCVRFVAHTQLDRAGHEQITRVCTLGRAPMDLKVPSLATRTAKLDAWWDQRGSSDTFKNTMEHSCRPAAPKSCLRRREGYSFILRICLWKQLLLSIGWKRSAQWKQTTEDQNINCPLDANRVVSHLDCPLLWAGKELMVWSTWSPPTQDRENNPQGKI